MKEAGIRSCLCYEVSERDGEEKTAQSIKENADFAKWAKDADDSMIKAMFGGHALFTISDKTFEKMVEANNGMTGFHIHVAEGMNDVYDSLRNYGCRPVNRLLYNGILGEKTLLGHCIHISPAEMDIIKETGTMVVNNPQSNQGNAVGMLPGAADDGKGYHRWYGYRCLYPRYVREHEGILNYPASQRNAAECRLVRGCEDAV